MQYAGYRILHYYRSGGNREMNNIIFGHFSDGAVKAINSFCKQIDNSPAEVFILMARKSICFLKLLVKCGKINSNFFEKLVVADTSLDFPSEYLHNKRIAIIDDIMISGTSIAKIANLLLDMEIPPENIEVIVLAIDRKYNFMDFIDPKSGISLFNRERTSDFEDPECIRLSNDIAQMIAVAGESYNVDFPEYNRFTVDDKKFESFFNKSLWNIYEVTNVFHQKGGNVVYTFIPKPAVVDRVSQYLKCNIWKFSQLKIRLIAHKNNEHEYSCVIVPLVVIGKISFESLHKIWECILGEDLEQPIGRIHWNNTALFRLIQFFIPMVLANMFIKWNELSGFVSLDFTCIPMLFGYDYASLIAEFASKNWQLCANEKIVVISKVNKPFSKN